MEIIKTIAKFVMPLTILDNFSKPECRDYVEMPLSSLT